MKIQPRILDALKSRASELLARRVAERGEPPPFTQQREPPKPARIPNVAKVVLVASGKGGVGKSTTAVNLAAALARQSRSVGILDADVFGPSVPRLMRVDGPAETVERDGRRLLRPASNYGVQLMSMGLLVPEEQAVAWRGMMVGKALQQLLFGVAWDPPLDVLLVDTPPGTGDTQLTLAQRATVDGAVVVTTPHSLAVSVAARGAALLRTLQIPILGAVVNMAALQCPNCGTDVLQGTADPAAALGAPVLAKVPLSGEVGDLAEKGMPVVVGAPNSPAAAEFDAAAQRLWTALAKK